jgi:plastocyanin
MGVAVLALAASQGSRADGATATASGARSVDIDHFAFHPPTLRIAKGGKVAFANSSNVTHTATRGGSFDTGRIKAGTTKVVQFDQTGTFAYHCRIHPFMKGKIVVE